MPTISEKILSRASGSNASAGEIVEVDVDCAMSHDGTSVLAIKAFQDMGSTKVWDPKKIVVPFDHQIPANNDIAANLQLEVRAWVKEQGITNFYDCGSGVCHQVFSEEGFALPGSLIIGADSHSCTYGAFGAFATGVGATDMADVYSRGRIWLRVPKTVGIRIEGKLKPNVSAKDVILRIIGDVGADGATYQALEYVGSTVREMSMAGRMTLCNMGVEMGAKAAMVPPDETTCRYLEDKARKEYMQVTSDAGSYDSERCTMSATWSPRWLCPSGWTTSGPSQTWRASRWIRSWWEPAPTGALRICRPWLES